MRRGFHQTNGIGSSSISVVPFATLRKRFYGAFVRRQFFSTPKSVMVQAFNTAGKTRKRPVTLATKPFDYTEGDQ